MTKVIAITGGIATGKSVIRNMLREKNYPIIDLDQTVHNLENENETVIKQIAALFGSDIIENNKINRRKLANVVFDDKQAMKNLIKILNPFLINEINQKNDNNDVVIIEAPTLFENGLQIYVDKIIAVTCDPIIQMQRLQMRNGISISQANKLIKNQWPQTIKAELADYVIDSSNGIDDLKKQVTQTIVKLR